MYAAAMWEIATVAGLEYAKVGDEAVVMVIVVVVRLLAVAIGKAPVLAVDVVGAWVERVFVLRGRRREVDAR